METTFVKRKSRPNRIPAHLLKETLDGHPIYYKGYQEAINTPKSSNKVIGSSSLQSLILWYLSRIVLNGKALDDSRYFVFTGEPGLHLAPKNNLAGDLMIYDRQQVSLFDAHYFKTPPLVNVEIDNGTFSDYEYIRRKTSHLLDFGVARVIWVLSVSRQVIVAEPQKDWLVIDWHKDIELFNGITFNIPAYFAQEGLSLSIDE